MVFMNNTNKSKTISAWEIKSGDMIRISHKGQRYEMNVESVRKNNEESTVSIWGSWVFFGIGASEAVILVEREAE